MISSIAVIIGLTILVSLSSAYVDHDGWEFRGGRRRRQLHGLNSAVAGEALADGEDKSNIRYDRRSSELPELLITNDEAPPTTASHPNLAISTDRIESKRQLLLLSDYSAFDSNAARDPNEASVWGRLYVDGMPDSMQYFRARFGYPPTTGKLLLASPLHMCDDTGDAILHNGNDVDTHTTIVAVRGGCTFGEKALVAKQCGAVGILYVNNEEGLFHPSGPDARYAALSAAMITQHDGEHLISALEKIAQEENGNNVLTGRFVPILCDNTGSSCGPVHHADFRFEKELHYTGRLVSEHSNEYFDYIQGEFGSWLDPFKSWEISLPTDTHCCDRARIVDYSELVMNTTAMLCLRGECDFLTKAEYAEEAGAGLMILGSNDGNITRMGADPPHRGRKVKVATVMVRFDSYEDMVNNYDTDGMPSTFRVVNDECPM